MSNTKQPADLLRTYLETFPDIESLADLLAEDVVFKMYADGERSSTPRGRVIRGLQKEFESFYRRDSFQIDIQSIFGNGELAAVRYTITANTHLGPYKNNYVIVARFEDDLLVEGWEYPDALSARSQLSPAADQH